MTRLNDELGAVVGTGRDELHGAVGRRGSLLSKLWYELPRMVNQQDDGFGVRSVLCCSGEARRQS